MRNFWMLKEDSISLLLLTPRMPSQPTSPLLRDLLVVQDGPNLLVDFEVVALGLLLPRRLLARLPPGGPVGPPLLSVVQGVAQQVLLVEVLAQPLLLAEGPG